MPASMRSETSFWIVYVLISGGGAQPAAKPSRAVAIHRHAARSVDEAITALLARSKEDCLGCRRRRVGTGRSERQQPPSYPIIARAKSVRTRKSETIPWMSRGAWPAGQKPL